MQLLPRARRTWPTTLDRSGLDHVIVCRLRSRIISFVTTDTVMFEDFLFFLFFCRIFSLAETLQNSEVEINHIAAPIEFPADSHMPDNRRKEMVCRASSGRNGQESIDGNRTTLIICTRCLAHNFHRQTPPPLRLA
jgi:hypothetical protein